MFVAFWFFEATRIFALQDQYKSLKFGEEIYEGFNMDFDQSCVLCRYGHNRCCANWFRVRLISLKEEEEKESIYKCQQVTSNPRVILLDHPSSSPSPLRGKWCCLSAQNSAKLLGGSWCWCHSMFISRMTKKGPQKRKAAKLRKEKSIERALLNMDKQHEKVQRSEFKTERVQSLKNLY